MTVLTRRMSYWLVAVVMATGLASSVADAQPTRPPPKIGVVDLDRLVRESPQAQNAKKNMAERFAKRKNALEAASAELQSEMDRLKNNADSMSDDERDQLSSKIRDDKHQLQLKQSQYNDDVSDAEQKELDHMRSDLRQVIDDYAKNNGYDLIMGDSVLYASDSVDITDAILQRLKTQADQDAKQAKDSQKAKSAAAGGDSAD
ncbi:OmpH family outer membrane protein [Salinisphaera hydrothermalis]|uniref:Periplasmic chaperone for outer membrane proteins Skp n=1 Tax=Salinisphaera hydrothermalis (strain C41B8) TaxID=1304275 RepID=A0A084IK08_SALHC|nr:OmpH family outer membrane protein [Salinisphaera hydrothermalis]KEZ77042.1 periplasmic chaperone for outer membrane proteins Skp [Salinisphaera hydrothermalis C41B8]